MQPEPSTLPFLQEPVVAGVSGGRDSVALLRLLVRQGCRVVACHVHHGIRGAAADADAAFCRALCTQLGVPYAEHRINVPELAAQTHQSLETAARTARRAALAETARAHGCRAVALAQHADDQAETVLFRLARGSAGCRGMLPVHEAQGILWLRPLLHLRRAEITAWLQTLNQPWVEDATNAVADVARNKIRLEVLPALNRALERDVTPVLTRSARQQAETLEALECALEALPLCDPQGRLYLPFLAGKPLPFRKAVLHRYLARAGVPDLSEAHVLAVDAALPPDAPCAAVPLPGGYVARRREKRLTVEPPATKQV